MIVLINMNNPDIPNTKAIYGLTLTAKLKISSLESERIKSKKNIMKNNLLNSLLLVMKK